MFRPGLDGGLDAGAAHLGLQQRFQLLDIALTLGAARFQRRGNAPVLQRFEIAKREVFQFPFDLPYPEAIGEGRIHFASLDRELALAGCPHVLGGAHFLQLLGEPDHDQAHVADHRQQHLAQRLGLGRFEPSIRSPVGRQSELPELTQRPRQPRRLFAEAFLGAGLVDVAAVQQRLNHGRDDDIVVGIQGAHDLGHVQRRAAYQITLRRQCQVEQRRHPGL